MRATGKDCQQLSAYYNPITINYLLQVTTQPEKCREVPGTLVSAEHLSRYYFSKEREESVKLIGLTGNIASGKSTVARLLVELGAEHLDADRLVHEMYEPGTTVTTEIAEAFGANVLAPDGGVDRRVLGELVFNDPEALGALEAIVHPRTGTLIAERIQEAAARANPPPAMVIEAVKLIESGSYRLMDEVWFVVAQERVQKQRLMEERGWSEEEAEDRLQAQPPIKERLHHADVIIENSGSMETLKRQVRDAWRRLVGEVEEERNDA